MYLERPFSLKPLTRLARVLQSGVAPFPGFRKSEEIRARFPWHYLKRSTGLSGCAEAAGRIVVTSGEGFGLSLLPPGFMGENA